MAGVGPGAIRWRPAERPSGVGARALGTAAAGRPGTSVVDSIAAAGAVGQRRPGSAATVLARTRRIRCRTRVDRNGFRSECADNRFREASADVQAVNADAARPGPAGEAAARREAARATDRGGEIASRRRGRQGADPAGGAVRRPARGTTPYRVPARL